MLMGALDSQSIDAIQSKSRRRASIVPSIGDFHVAPLKTLKDSSPCPTARFTLITVEMPTTSTCIQYNRTSISRFATRVAAPQLAASNASLAKHHFFHSLPHILSDIAGTFLVI
jgi:hypothetical protein